nr:phage tail protein I [Rubricella aquisinus]
MLPVTAPPLAKALDILEERLFALPVEMISKDPETADVALLDHLAWENSVDVWDANWPEEIKRNVIAASAELHRHKGTPFAIKRALAALDVRAELLEWFDDPASLAPGTFRVTAYVGRSLSGAQEIFIDDLMVRTILAVIERSAPVSRGFDLTVGAALKSTTRLGLHASTIQSRTARMSVVQADATLPVTTGLGLGASALTITTTRLT